MSNLQQYQNVEVTPAAYTPADSSSLIVDANSFEQLERFATVMAKSKSMVPVHMQGNVGDCMAVAMQSLQWGMNPFAVAQKTFVINGVLGYEAQLINAVITTNAPVTGRLQFEWYGDWDLILGNIKEVKYTDKKDNKEKTFRTANWNIEQERGLGVRVWATIVGEQNPRVLDLKLVQAVTRNSPLWVQDPKQQLAYLAIKRWARLYCPDVIMGVYSPDELRDRNVSARDVTPKVKNTGSAGLLDRLTKPIPEEVEVATAFNPDELMAAIKDITELKQGAAILAEIQAIDANEKLSLDPADRKILMAELAKAEKPMRAEYANILKSIRSANTTEDLDRLHEVVKDKSSGYPDSGKEHLNNELQLRLEAISA